jgi:hypothetical protein
MEYIKYIWNFLFCSHDMKFSDSETFITEDMMAFCVHTYKCKKCGILKRKRI